jgi:hypothetical protein
MITNSKDNICVLILSLHVPVEGAARDDKIMATTEMYSPF